MKGIKAKVEKKKIKRGRSSVGGKGDRKRTTRKGGKAMAGKGIAGPEFKEGKENLSGGER